MLYYDVRRVKTFFFHSGCAIKHRILKDNEIVRCEGPFEQIASESEKMEMKKTSETSSSRERLGSMGSAKASTSGNIDKKVSVDVKIDWLIRTVKEIKDEITCRNEIKTMIKQVIREELEAFKREVKVGKAEMAGSGQRNYSEAVKDNRKESILIVKPKKEQRSETTKQVVKEKVDIKNLAVGITKLRKGGTGSVIWDVRERER